MSPGPALAASTGHLWREQLPMRLARTCARGERLQGRGWDINIAHRQAEECALLADACRELGMGELAGVLEALHQSVGRLLEPPHLPQQTEAAEIAALHARLDGLAAPAGAMAAPEAAGVPTIDQPTHENGFPLFVVPPADYWEVLRSRLGAQAATNLGGRIRHALDNDGLRLVFQPMVPLHDGEDGQFQALLRMRDRGGRMLSAGELLPAASEAGLLGAIDRWALEHAIMLLSARLPADGVQRLFVTQARESLRDGTLGERLADRLAHWRVAGDALTLEFHVADVLALPEAARHLARATRALGVRLAVGSVDPADALGLLAQLPVDFVKLTSTPGEGALDAESLHGLVEELHARGARVIAQRVEQAADVARWHAAGADYVQGNFVQAADSELVFDFTEARL